MERIPDDPRQELLIAIAGPLVNVAIAAVLILSGGLAAKGFGLADLEKASLLQRLAFTNVALVVFNMAPAFPMDGGRVLRALLAMRLGARRATGIAARLGQVFAFIFVAAGLFVNPLLIFVGLFVYIAAVSEQQSSEFRWFAHDLKVSQGMERTARSLALKASLGDAAEAVLATAQRDFAVVDPANRPVGLLDRDTLLAGLKEKGPEAPVAEVMGRPVTVLLNSPLEDAVNAMNQQGLKTYVVVDDDGRLAGLLTRENVAEMIMIHAARPDWKFPSGARQPSARL